MITLYVQEPSGFREASIDDVMACAHRCIAQRFRKGSPVFTAPALAREFLSLQLSGLEHEVFGCLYLDTRHRLIQSETLFRGTIDGTAVYPREVVKRALAHNAAALICYHNHPSGNPEPGKADEVITHRLRDALALVDVRLLDHLIVGETVYSMAEAGLL